MFFELRLELFRLLIFFVVFGFIFLESICSILKGDILVIGISSVDWITIYVGVF